MANTLPANQNAGVGSTHHNRSRHARQVARAKKAKLNRPLFPGGLTTVGEFRRARRAAVQQEFAPQEQQINDAARTIPTWYQDYLAKLKSLQTQTAEQFQGLQSQAASLNQPLEQGATPNAQAAGDARANLIKAIQGSLMQQQGAQANKLSDYSAIAGARKIQKQEDIQKSRKELAQAKGNFRADYTAKAKQQEFENALAAKEFGLKRKETNAQIKQDKYAAKHAETTYDKEFSKQAAKYGYSPHDWKLLGPKGRAKTIAENQKRGRQPRESLGRIQKKEEIKTATKYGYTPNQWRSLTPQKRAAIIRGDNKTANKDKGTEHGWRTQLQQGEASTAAAQSKILAEKLKNGEGIAHINKSGHKRTRAEVAKILLNDPKAKEPVIISAVLDMVYNGYISRGTTKRLRDSGIKARQVAEALGGQIYQDWNPYVNRPNYLH